MKTKKTWYEVDIVVSLHDTYSKQSHKADTLKEARELKKRFESRCNNTSTFEQLQWFHDNFPQWMKYNSKIDKVIGMFKVEKTKIEK